MRRAVGAEQAGVPQRAGVPAVGLHLAGARGVHGGEVGIGDDDLVAEGFKAARHPFAVGGGFQEDASPGPIPEHRCEALGLGADPLLDQLAPLARIQI